MLAHCNVGSSAYNMRQEVYCKWLNAAVTGKESVYLPFFLGDMCEHKAGRAAEEILKAVNVLEQQIQKRLYTFQFAPVVTMKVWGLVKQMEAKSHAWLCIMGPDDTIKRYNDLYAAIDKKAVGNFGIPFGKIL